MNFFQTTDQLSWRIATGLKKILETNELVTNITAIHMYAELYEAFSTRLSWRN